VTSWPGTRVGTVLAAGLLFVTLAAGSADQQLNGTNPRAYDFEGALSEVQSRARPGDVVLYSPKDIANIVVYYGDGLKAQPASGPLPDKRAGRVFVVGSFLEKPEVRRATEDTIHRLGRDRKLVDTFERTHVTVWELR
jgi:hypothetical protein